MPITAYSAEFNKELTPENYLQHFYEKYHKDAPIDFIKNDIECPCCGVKNGYIVPKTPHKQGHFAFKSELKGESSHLIACCFFKNELEDNNLGSGFVKSLGREQSHITILIHALIATGLSKNIFTYSDMKEFRLWFFNIRSAQDYKITHNEHLAKILQHAFEKNTRTIEYKVYDRIIKREDVSGLLTRIKEDCGIFLKVFDFKKNLTDALHLSRSFEGEYCFRRLPDFYETSQKVYSLSFTLLNQAYTNKDYIYTCLFNQSESSKRMSFSVMKQRSKLFNAYSFLLLNINKMDTHKALSMHLSIVENINVEYIKDYPNLISINPLHKFSAWAIVEIISKASTLQKSINFQEIYDEELSNHAKWLDNRHSYFTKDDENKPDLPF